MKFKFFLVLIMLNLLCISALVQANESPFGSATPNSTSLKGDINYLPEGTSPLPDSSSLTDLKWQGMNEDKVGEWDSGSPDGRNDGHFLLNLSLPRQIEIKSITIYSADANGTHVGGQVWDTASTNYWILGVFYQGNQLDQHHASSLGSFSGNVQFDLYGDDSGWFKSGNWFEVEVILGDGTKLTKLISISSNVDLTGVWDCDDGGKYYLKQLGSTLWWYGEHSPTDPTWSNVAHGTINGSTISLDWTDVPKGKILNSGILTLNVVSNDQLQATAKTGGFSGSVWTRALMTANMTANPPKTLYECENGGTEICGTWTLRDDGVHYDAKWNNGAAGTLTISSWGSDTVNLSRLDSDGQFKGTYTGVLDNLNKRINNGQVTWSYMGRVWNGTWYANYTQT